MSPSHGATLASGLRTHSVSKAECSAKPPAPFQTIGDCTTFLLAMSVWVPLCLDSFDCRFFLLPSSNVTCLS